MTDTIQTFKLVDVHTVLNEAMIRLCDDQTQFGAQVRDAAAVVRSKMEIIWNNRMTRAAGMAKWRRHFGIVRDLEMNLSPRLLERVDAESQANTITHEFAHLIQAVMRGVSDHGAEWNRIHRMLGGTGETYHHINREGLHRNRKRHVYVNPTGNRVVLTSHSVSKYQSYLNNNSYRLVEVLVYQGDKLVQRQTCS